MDQLSSMYVRMASSPQSQLHNPTAVVQVVDQLQGIIDRSTALRKNFLIDDTTPRADVVITETSAMKPSLGWITLRVTEGIRRGVHEWCIKIECQGETADGSGLMLGIVPKSFFKYDSFISQGGGWCLSRAGKFYGHWRRQDSSASNISFETGDRVIFWLDYEAARMTVRVGDKCIVGEMSNLNTEVFPAVSLHYRHQHVRFEYHMVHDRRSIPLNWMERRVLPPAAALLPLRVEQLEQLPLASYVTCPQLVSYVSSTHSRQPEGSSPASPASGGPATGSGEEATPASPQLVAEAATKESPQAVLTYMSLEASTARLCVVHNAFASVRRFMALSISRGQFLSPEVTAEYLRQLTAEPAKEAGSGGGGAAMLGGWPSGARGAKSSSYHYDAALNCGAMIVIHMFAHATSSSSSGMAVPIVTSLTQYLLSLPLFSLCESSNASVLEHGSLSPDIIQLAMDNLIKMVEPFMENEKEVLSSLHSALLELLLLLSLQRGSVSGALRVCRFLLRHPNGGVSSPVVEWLKQHAQSLRPQKELPDIGKAIRTVSEDSQLLIPTRIDAKVDVQSVGYGSGFLYTHNAEGLAKWGNTASEYVQIHRTKEPANCCVGSFRSSIAVTSSQVVLLTDRMIAEGIAVVGYSITLDVLRVYRLGEVAPTWPREARANPHISSGPGDAIVLVYEGYGDASTSGGATTAAATAERVDLEVHGFTGGNLMQPAWSTSLIPPAQDAHLTHCLALRKPSVIELGPPEEHLHVHGGHVTVELWVMLLHKEDAATLYQHGDKSTSGEIFLETVRLEGAFCLRGGYRHEPRGSCDVSAPLPPIAETNFFHVALVFDGRWRLFFDGEEVASNRQGPYVSLDSPKQRWTVGHNCTCLLAGLRVWGCGRAGREVARDYKRTLVGNEAGLVGQYLFHETSGNVAFNYASTPRRARHAVCVGAFSHVLCDNHPLRLGSPSAAPSLLSAMTPVRSPLHDWMDLARSTCFCTDSQLVLTTHLLGPSSPYALPGGRVLTFFDVKTGSGYSSLLFLTNKSSAKGRLGCDAATGQLRELFEHTSTTADKGKLIATAVLPLQQDEADGASTALMSQLEAADALPSACTASQTPVGGEGAGAAVSPFIRGGKYLREMPARLTYSALAVWLLQLMTMYAENEPTQGSCLYSPLADDVSCRCVSEVKGILMEHFRVVKGSNSRRSLTLKCEHSSTIALATLHILLRLVRRARSFGLHPSALGLHIVVPANSSEGMEILLREFTNMASPRRGTAAKRPSKEVEVADDVAARAGGTLLGLLGAIINESGSALSPQLGRIARMVVMEGVELFIPSARCRATLLREVLNTPPSTTGTSATAATTSASSSTATGERVPSLEVLLEAIVSSFSSVQAAMPFLHDLTDAAAAGGEGAENPKVALDELRETLEVLVGESLAQLRASSAPSSSTTTTAGGALRPPPSQRSARVASLLVAAISHLQLLFLSACQGDSGESRTLQPCEVEMLFSCPSTATYNQCVRRYYQRLFHAAAEGLQIVAKRGEQTGTPTLATRAALIELFRGSFLSGPLHAAVVAIPLIVSIEDASWFLAQLEKLLTLAQRMHLHGSDAEVQRSLQEAAQMGLSLEDSPFDALLHAFLFHSAWVANFMAKCITTSTTRGSMMLEEGSERGGNNSGGSSGGGGGGKGKLPYSNTPTSATTPRSRRPEDGKEDEEETEETPQMMQDGPPVDLALVQRMREIRRFCEDPLLSGGVDSAPPAKGLAARQRPRRDFVAAQLRQHAKTWTEAQKGFDALGARIPAELATLVMKMAATAIFLSNTPRLHRFAPKRLNELMIATMRRMMPLRNHHLNLLSSSDKAAQTALLTELERRCALLLQTDPAIEAQVDVLQLYPLSGFALMDEDPVEGAHNDDLSSAFRASDPTRGGGGVARNTAGLPPKPRARWKWAGERVRRVLILHRADALRNAQLDLNAAIALVQRVMQSEVLTAVELQRACAEAKKVAEIRLEGVRHLIRLVRREPTHTEEVARLVSSDSSRRTRHYEDGLSSCPRDTIVTVRTAIYDALKWTLASQRRRPSSSAALHLSSSRLSSASLGPATRTKSSIVEGSENLAMTAGSAMAVAELAHRKWRAHDFAFLRRLRIVEALWEPFCALLRREGDAVVLREESPVEQRHREEVAAHYQRKMQQHHDWVSSRKGTEADGSPTSGPSASLGDDAVEESLTVATSAELARRASLECIKSLGLQCAATMRQDLSVAHDLGCTTFLEHLLAVFETELKRCLDFMKLQETWSPALVRVQEQIGTITGLVGAVAAAIPEDSRFRPALRTSCSRLARCLYFLACCSAWDLRDAGSGAGSGAEESAPAQTLPCTPAANFRVAALLLRHCAPAGCNNVFEDEEARSMCKEIILDWQPGCAALHFFFAMAVRCLIATGLSDLSKHALLGLRSLLEQKAWAGQLAYVAKEYVHDLSSSGDMSAPERSRAIRGHKLFVWIVALGGHLPAIPSVGMRLCFQQEGMLVPKEGFFVDGPNGSKESVTVVSTERSYAWMLRPEGGNQPPLSSPLASAKMEVGEELQLPFDAIFSPPLNEAIVIPPFEGLLTQFICPAIQRWFATADHNEAAFTVMELAAQSSLLHLVGAVVRQQPELCAVLIERQSIAIVHRFALRSVARLPLPITFLKEYAAYALTYTMETHRTSTGVFENNVVSPRGPLTSQASDGNNSAQRLDTSLDTIHIVQPSTLLPSLAPPAPRLDVGSPPSIGWVPSEALAGMTNGGREIVRMLHNITGAAAGNGAALLSKLRGGPDTPLPSTLCLYVTTKTTEIPACITITPSCATNPNAKIINFPSWVDGISLEASLLLCDRIFPELGEDFSVPTSWGRPKVSFKIFSLYTTGTPDTGRPLLSLSIHKGQLICSIHVPNTQSGQIECRVALKADDWDRFTYISVLVDSGSLMLVKSGEVATAPLTPSLAAALEAILSKQGAVTKLVVGSPVPPGSPPGAEPNTPQIPEDRAMVLISGVRMWGSSVIKSSVKAVAEMVTRDQTLPPFDPSEESCFFLFGEGTGEVVWSVKETFTGRLQGAVRWTPCPFQAGCPLTLDRPDRLHVGTRFALPHNLPRSAVDAYFAALDVVGLDRVARDVLCTMAAHLSRMAVVDALRQALSPSYQVLRYRGRSGKQAQERLVMKDVAHVDSPFAPVLAVVGGAAGGGPIFNPFSILSADGLAKQLTNLFRYDDAGQLRHEDSLLLRRIISQALELWKSQQKDGSAALMTFLSETAMALRDLVRDDAELFHVVVPSSAHSSSGTEGRKGALLPLALINGGTGVLSFDAKSRTVDQATIFKDRGQKNVLAKYPDGQGGWPECTIPAETLWVFARVVTHSNTNTVAKPVAGAATLTLTVRSLRPAVLRSILAPIFLLLSREDPQLEAGLPYFLNAPLVASLLQQGSMSGSSEASLHAISLLTSIFEVWARHSRLQCFDHTPLHVVLVHINVPLVGLMQRGGIPGVSAPEMSVLLTPSLGTYNAYTQSLCNLLLSAIRLECAWRRRSYSSRIRQRWRRLMQLWEQSSFMAPQTARGGENATLTMDALGTNVASPNSREVPATNTDFTRTASPRTTNARSTAGGGGGGGGGGAESAAAKKRDVVPHVKDRAKGHISLIQLSAPSVGPSMNGTTSSGAVLYQRGNGLWHVHCDRHPVTVRSNIGFRKGRFFFEVRVPDNNCTLSVGVVTDRVGMFDAGHALGRDGNSWGFDGARLSRFHQGYRNDFSSRVKWKAGDVIGVLMDLELNRIACLHNDRQVSMFDRFRAGHHGPSASAQGDLPLAYFPAVTVGSCGCDINFGTAPFNSSVPIGYIPVDPTYYCTPEVSRTWCLATAVELAQKITKRQRRSSCTAYSGTTNSMAGDENLGQTPPEEELSHPALVLLHNHVKAYCDGRSGPLSIGLITSSTRAKITNNELRAEDAACVAKGTVAITKGKWYYEVLVHDDAAIGVGWILSDVDWSRSTGLGDEHSWTFECKRMIAKHNKKQLSLGRHQWKNGDVVGCAIDCDEGSMSFTINGSVQRRLHDGSGDGVLFQRVEMGSAGLTPCVALEPKSVCTVVWNKEELQHIPDGFKPLGAGSLVGEGVAKHFLTSDEDRASSPASPNNNASPTAAAATSSAFVPSKSSSIVGGGATLPSITLPMVERLLRHVSANVDLSPLNLSAYCLGGASKDGLKLNAIDGVQVEEFLPLWSVVTSLLDSLFPYGFVGSLPLDTDEANDLSMGPLHFAVSTLRRYAPPHLGLRTLRQFLAATNGAGESLKLTVNRRRALSVMREPSASPSERLRGSLFGQIFRLLALKNAALFTTNKKLWSVTFVGEGADDVGGPYRESLSQLCTELMGTGLSLFLPSPNQANELGESREVFVMNPSLQPPVDLYMFLFLGRLLGGCLRSAEPLPLYLPSTFWKLLVGESPYVQDLERSDAATVKSLDYIRSMGTKHKEGASSIHDVDAELQELCPGGFVMQDDSGVEHELITSGRSIPVDHSNVDLFVTLALAFKLHAMTAAQSFAVKQGFHQVVPLCAVSMLKWYELEELVCGQRDYDPDALLDGARYDRITMDDPRILHLRQVLRGFTRPQRAAFMRFVSGRERLPPGMHLRIMPDDTRREDGGGRDGITPRPPSQQREGTAPSGAARHLHSAQGQSSPSGADYNDDRLPHASTCFFWLSLPRYSSEAALREKLLYAIGQCLDIDADFRVRDNDAVPHEEEPTMARVQIEDEDEFEDFSHLR